MAHSRHTQASLTDLQPIPPEELDDTALDEASRRAWTKAMTVRPFGSAYLVDCGDETRYVSLAPGTCSCGRATVDDPCEHVRRVAIEINLGRVPPPSERTVECRGCGRAVAVSAADSPPALCSECHLEPGDLVVDRAGEERTPLLVVSEPGRPADLAVVRDDDRTVAEYPGNDAFPPDSPVVEVVYPRAVSIDRAPRRYLFPLARLRQPDLGDDRPPECDGSSTVERDRR